MLAWQVRGKRVLVVGGGDVSFPSRMALLLDSSRLYCTDWGFRSLQAESSMSSMPMQRSLSYRPEIGSTEKWHTG